MNRHQAGLAAHHYRRSTPKGTPVCLAEKPTAQPGGISRAVPALAEQRCSAGVGLQSETAGAESLVSTFTACWRGLYQTQPCGLNADEQLKYTSCSSRVYFLVRLHPIDIVQLTPVM